MDTSDPNQPKIVHAFMPRDTAGYSIKETWDVLGMRATRSDDTLLDEIFVPDRYIARVVPAGFGGADFFVLCIFAWALMGFANVYYAIAKSQPALPSQTLAQNLVQNSATVRQFLTQAVTLYQGTLLPGYYDSWIIHQREVLQQQVVDALDRLVTL